MKKRLSRVSRMGASELAFSMVRGSTALFFLLVAYGPASPEIYALPVGIEDLRRSEATCLS